MSQQCQQCRHQWSSALFVASGAGGVEGLDWPKIHKGFNFLMLVKPIMIELSYHVLASLEAHKAHLKRIHDEARTILVLFGRSGPHSWLTLGDQAWPSALVLLLHDLVVRLWSSRCVAKLSFAAWRSRASASAFAFPAFALRAPSGAQLLSSLQLEG